MIAYIVNLKDSIDRKNYMLSLLEKNKDNIEVEFVEAVDGRKLSEAETKKIFDVDRFAKEMAKNVRPGEVGCTLSHQKCYNKLLQSNQKSVIIFEDDLVINESVAELIPKIEKWLDTEEPRVLLLSGWYWHKRLHNFDTNHKLTNIVDGLLTHAYALNRAAAKLMVDPLPWYVADAWEMFKYRGVRISALKPHPFDQDWSGVFKTTVNDGLSKRTKTDIFHKLKIKFRGARNKILKLLGFFEHPQKHPTIKI